MNAYPPWHPTGALFHEDPRPGDDLTAPTRNPRKPGFYVGDHALKPLVTVVISRVCKKLPLLHHRARYDCASRAEESQSTIEFQSFSQDGTSKRRVSYEIWRGRSMENLRRLWCQDEGQDIAEYAVMLAVILVIVVGTIRLIGSNANHTFSSVASSIQ